MITDKAFGRARANDMKRQRRKTKITANTSTAPSRRLLMTRHLLATLQAQPDGRGGQMLTGMVGGARYVIMRGRGDTWRLYVETDSK